MLKIGEKVSKKEKLIQKLKAQSKSFSYEDAKRFNES